MKNIKILGLVIFMILASVTLVSGLSEPYALNGRVYDIGSNPVVGATITFTNMNTSANFQGTTSTGGEYQEDALRFTNYYDNDVVQYVCTYAGISNTTTANITVSGGGTIHDIYLPATVFDAANLTAVIGSEYIKWVWDYGNGSNYSVVYIDGKFVTTTFLNQYILSGLGSREEHTITLANSLGTSSISSTARTFYPSIIFYIVFLLAMILLIAEIFLKEIISVFAGVLAFVLSLFAFYLSFPFYFSLLSYLCVAMAAIAMIWLILTIITLLTKSLDDLEEF